MSKSNYRATLYLGTTREDFKQLPSERIYLSKHTWDCGWYWGFGYIGNKNLHTHFDITFLVGGTTYDLPKVFSDTKLTQNNWWTILEMFSSAYKLREAADLYNRGGSHITTNLCKDKLQDKELSDRINKDLELLLDRVWKYIEDSIEENTKKEIVNDA
jgi:hypothetical protein